MSNALSHIWPIYLQNALQQGASDLHLHSGVSPAMRIQGQMLSTDFSIIIYEDLSAFLESIMDEPTRERLKKQWEVDFAYTWTPVRFRVNIFRKTDSQGQKGISAVFRIIPEAILTLDELQMPPIVKKIALLPQGLVLVTGPTGSGKSTTLAAIVNQINNHQAKHIITIEDPIEFLYSHKKSLITQREVHRDTQSFQTALRSALREDPNVILIGELRDAETIRLAITAAETGHLVLATLHTRSAEQSIHRIIDHFSGDEKNIVRSMLAESLEAVIAQTLVSNVDNTRRLAIVEILLATPAVRHLIREGKTAQMVSVMQTGLSVGMQTRQQHLEQLIQQGKIDPTQ